MTQEAKLQIQFAIPSVQRQALNSKLQQIKRAKDKLNRLLKIVQQKIEKQNDTLRSYYQLDSLKQRLDDAERDIEVNLSMQQPSKIKHVRLKALLSQIQVAEHKRQLTRNKLEKQYNWSVQLQTGAQQNVTNNNFNQSVQPYVAVFLRYNLVITRVGHVCNLTNRITERFVNLRRIWRYYSAHDADNLWG